MDNLSQFLYLGFSCVMFCLALWLLMTYNKEILKMLDSLSEIVLDNIVVDCHQMISPLIDN